MRPPDAPDEGSWHLEVDGYRNAGLCPAVRGADDILTIGRWAREPGHTS